MKIGRFAFLSPFGGLGPTYDDEKIAHNLKSAGRVSMKFTQ